MIFKNKRLLLPIILSVMAICLIIKTNSTIAQHYIHADGKTKALFGLNLVLSYSYKYFYAFLIVFASIFLFIGWKKHTHKTLTIISILLIVCATILLFADVWKWMI